MKALGELFRKAGRAHHQAFPTGEDPEWPLWYAEYLWPELQAYTHKPLTKSELVWWLVQTDREVKGADWPEQYAQRFLEIYGEG